MPATSVVGSQITFKFATVDYSAQVTGGSVNDTFTVPRIRTLSSVARPKTDAFSAADVNLLFDDEAAAYGALRTAAAAGTGTAVEWAMADAKLTGTMYIESINIDYDAESETRLSVSMSGELTTVADMP